MRNRANRSRFDRGSAINGSVKVPQLSVGRYEHLRFIYLALPECGLETQPKPF